MMLKQTVDCLAWFARAVAAFLRFQPVLTASVIFLLAVAQLTQVISIFLPLKVIILVGSEGVPRYLRSFLDPDARELAIGFLLALTIIAFAVTYAARGLADYLSRIGGGRALARANLMALPSREQSLAPTVYAQICNLASSIAFVVLAMGLLAWIAPVVAATQLLCVLLEFGLTVLLLDRSGRQPPHALGRRIAKNTGGYLEILSTVNLLVGFIALLLVLVFDSSSQFVLMLLAFLLLRRTLQLVKKAINQLIRLAEKRNQFDPLIFRRAKASEPTEAESQAAFREVFAKTGREALSVELLGSPESELTLETRWQDPSRSGVYQFSILARQGEQIARYYDEVVFAAGSVHLLEHEEFLFTYMHRGALLAPEVLARAAHHDYTVQVRDGLSGQRPSKQAWPQLHQQVIARLWCAKLPRRLIKAYFSARRSLDERLSREQLSRARVAVDDADEAEVLAALEAALPGILARTRDMPRAIYNPAVTPANCKMDDAGAPYILSWWYWAIEPIGFGLPRNLVPGVYDTFAERATRSSDFQGPIPCLAEVQLVSDLSQLESCLRRSAYKQVLSIGRKVLAFFSEAEAVTESQLVCRRTGA